MDCGVQVEVSKVLVVVVTGGGVVVVRQLQALEMRWKAGQRGGWGWRGGGVDLPTNRMLRCRLALFWCCQGD